MPESEPGPQWLAHIDHQNPHGSAIANEAHDDCGIQDGLEFGALEDIDQKPGKECSSTQCDHPEIKKDPQPEGETVVHVGLVEPVVQAQPRCVNSYCEENHPGSKPSQKPRQRNSLFAASYPSTVGESRARHVVPPKKLLHLQCFANSALRAFSPRTRSICKRLSARSRCEPANGMNWKIALLA